ncbi:ABC transporter ATP-binding protein [Nitrospirales bacterium NOB]|nr:ABC transporter ATP-binding protein [Bryobacterales bacterium]MDL1888572.1 ABC transporter ATP-binding protein [Nitrospirales bacterium NOB]
MAEEQASIKGGRVLRIQDLSKHFGGLRAISDVSIAVDEGEMVGIIGPNGAGKSTLFNLITGNLRPTAGRIEFMGHDIVGTKPHAIAGLGIGRTFQLNPLFAEFTVLENVQASFFLKPKSGLIATFFGLASYRRNEAIVTRKAQEILELLGLDDVRDEPAKSLPQGRQKLLGIARALAIQPRLLLLDEPLGGLSRTEIDSTMQVIQALRTTGMTILLVEHNMIVMDIVDRIHVLNFGCRIASGTMEELRRNPAVIEAYFGTD